jgi:Flp pilus assembly protein TadD
MMCTNPHSIATILAVILLAGPALAGEPTASGPASPKASSAMAAANPLTPAKPAPVERLHKALPNERQAAERLDPLARAAFWTREADIDPSDAEAGIRLSVALRQLARYDEADAAATKVIALHPDNVEAIMEIARARISERQGFYAIQPLKQASRLAPKDWRPYSLLGVALEQSLRPAEALEAYNKALALSPDNPAVLSNLAMFHAAKGERAEAEALLRRAVVRPDATIQVRQNLALIIGLEGKLDEAERLIREDLPPEVATSNLAYLRSVQPGAKAVTAGAAPAPARPSTPDIR